MAFGYRYWMVHLPDIEPQSFLLFVHNPAGSTKLRDYSSGVERIVGQPPAKSVFSRTAIGRSRFECSEHTYTDDQHWYEKTVELNRRYLKVTTGAPPVDIQRAQPGEEVMQARGRASRGSQRQLQDYVNKEAELLSQAILNALPVRVRELKARIRWVSPLASDSYREYRDAEFLDRVGLSGHAAELAHFWPSRGPSWDALGIVSDQEGKMKPGVLLVEAKSHVAEVYGNGCQASPKSRARITQALQDAQEWVGASGGSDWLGPLYQSGNRIAHLYFLLERIRNPAWLINLYFIDDPIGPTSRRSWEREIASVKTQLGLVQRVKNMIEVFMSTFSATQNSIPEGER